MASLLMLDVVVDVAIDAVVDVAIDAVVGVAIDAVVDVTIDIAEVVVGNNNGKAKLKKNNQ